MDIEKNIKKLEAILEKMEKETVSIEESMALYTEAVTLLRTTQDRLSEIEQKIINLDDDND
ncbi:exodeoxyribonuclease VII small subunit [Parahalioglobus pacificus]|uniref:Exodeoxyribonuclease VII small subunit n=1 Tax=Parahalioglobus pacificus TaxID=930806 RepID=A0A919CN18_9GAMM|nr:exodeoxyribonuclease VII small subunit [Halioglobus pacificus]GHD39366.1 hypothetical protein GCM10007053_30740 [Halioglobus pacificus]